MGSSNYFVGIYSRGPNWLPGKAILEQPLETHFAYMETLQGNRILVLGGPFKDNEGALAVIETTSLTQAQQIFAADPGVKQGVFSVSVHPWFVSVEGQIHKKSW